jgi:hypothetical protein
MFLVTRQAAVGWSMSAGWEARATLLVCSSRQQRGGDGAPFRSIRFLLWKSPQRKVYVKHMHWIILQWFFLVHTAHVVLYTRCKLPNPKKGGLLNTTIKLNKINQIQASNVTRKFINAIIWAITLHQRAQEGHPFKHPGCLDRNRTHAHKAQRPGPDQTKHMPGIGTWYVQMAARTSPT